MKAKAHGKTKSQTAAASRQRSAKKAAVAKKTPRPSRAATRRQNPAMTDDEEDHREGEAGFELESASAPSALHLLPPPSRDSTLAAAQADPATLTDPATSTSHDSIASRLMQEFARRFTGSLCDDLDELSHAETEVESKSGEIIVKPEWSIRMRATELKLAYLIGRPIQRQQVLQAQVQPGYEDLVAEARRSPAFRSTLRDLLREIEAQPGGDEGVAGME